jgi:esterase/lipase
MRFGSVKKFVLACVLVVAWGGPAGPWLHFGAGAKPLLASEFVPSGLNRGTLPMDRGFGDYVRQAKDMIARARVFFDPAQREREIELNAPFEIAPGAGSCGTAPRVGLIMVHGLSGSPMIWRDLSRRLSMSCVHIRAVLLPGHGTRAADLMHTSHVDWMQTVRLAVRRFRPRVDRVVVAGFSMGATIATLLAHEGEPIDGLILLAPAFRSGFAMQRFTPFFSNFIDWLDRDPIEEPGRYDALPMRAAAEFHRMTERLRHYLETDRMLRAPVYMALSSDDVVIDVELALRSFRTRFTSPMSRLVLIGKPADTAALIGGRPDARIFTLTSHLPEQRILKFSHLAMPFSPENWFYGRGNFRNCNGYQPGTRDFKRCRSAADFYYTNARDDDDSPVKFRLTFNPYFEHLSRQIIAFLNSPGITTGIRRAPVR